MAISGDIPFQSYTSPAQRFDVPTGVGVMTPAAIEPRTVQEALIELWKQCDRMTGVLEDVLGSGKNAQESSSDYQPGVGEMLMQLERRLSDAGNLALAIRSRIGRL